MPNIKFHYLYRDSGNYKKFGFVIMSNPHDFALKDAELEIRRRLIDGEYFYANKWDLPDLKFSGIDIDNGPTWHEFHKIEFTNEPATINFLNCSSLSI